VSKGYPAKSSRRARQETPILNLKTGSACFLERVSSLFSGVIDLVPSAPGAPIRAGFCGLGCVVAGGMLGAVVQGRICATELGGYALAFQPNSLVRPFVSHRLGL